MRSHLQHRKDGNHDKMLLLARGIFMCVEDWHNQDVGFDLLVKTYGGTVRMVEIKDGSLPPSRRRLTPKEEMMAARWGDVFAVAETEDDLRRISFA